MKKLMTLLVAFGLVMGVTSAMAKKEVDADGRNVKAAPKGTHALCVGARDPITGEPYKPAILSGAGRYCCQTGGKIKLVSVNACNGHPYYDGGLRTVEECLAERVDPNLISPEECEDLNP